MKKLLLFGAVALVILAFAGCNTSPQGVANKHYSKATREFDAGSPSRAMIKLDRDARTEIDQKKPEYLNDTISILEGDDDPRLLLFSVGATSENDENRFAVATAQSCPDILIAWIASNDPNYNVRMCAQGNIFFRESFPSALLEKLATSEYPDARLTAVSHVGCTPEMAAKLLGDSELAIVSLAKAIVDAVPAR